MRSAGAGCAESRSILRWLRDFEQTTRRCAPSLLTSEGLFGIRTVNLLTIRKVAVITRVVKLLVLFLVVPMLAQSPVGYHVTRKRMPSEVTADGTTSFPIRRSIASTSAARTASWSWTPAMESLLEK